MNYPRLPVCDHCTRTADSLCPDCTRPLCDVCTCAECADDALSSPNPKEPA